jgi:Lhr-like helicase
MNIYRILNKIKYFPQDIKHYYQRAKKGYSFRDVWGIDSWFEEIMPEMLSDLKKNKHGCPVQFSHNEDGTEKDFETGMKDWQDTIDHMIFCFREMNDDTCSMKNEYEDEYYKQRFNGKAFKDRFVSCGEDEKGEKMYEFITEEVERELEENFRKKTHEIEEYKNNMKNEGFELFSKYFWNLWD